MPLGHEMAGVVEAVGAESSTSSVGDRVVVHPGDDDLGRIGNGAAEGGLAPQCAGARGGRAAAASTRCPTTSTSTVAALAEPSAVGMNAVDQGEVGPDDRVVIFGAARSAWPPWRRWSTGATRR